MGCYCAVCDSAISHNGEDLEIVKCTKCANIFHPTCSGIQDGWVGHLKFQCSILEIECRKHTKFIKRTKREFQNTESDMTNITSGNIKHESQGTNANVNKCSLKRPLSPPSSENTGLTQELRNLSLRSSQSKSEVAETSNERSIACDSRIKNSKDFANSTCRNNNQCVSIGSPVTTREPSKKVSSHADSIPKVVQSLARKQVRDPKDERKTREHFIVKNTEEQSVKVNLGDDPKLPWEVHNKTPLTNWELVSPRKSPQVPEIELNPRRSDESPPNKLSPAQLKPQLQALVMMTHHNHYLCQR